MPKSSYTAILEREGDLYVALCPECADPQEVKRRLHSEVFVTRFEAAHG